MVLLEKNQSIKTELETADGKVESAKDLIRQQPDPGLEITKVSCLKPLAPSRLRGIRMRALRRTI